MHQLVVRIGVAVSWIFRLAGPVMIIGTVTLLVVGMILYWTHS